MKRIALLTVMTAFLFSAAGVYAAQDSNIAFINLPKIIMESKAGKEAKDSFSKDMEAKRLTLMVKEKETKVLEEEVKAAAKAKPDVRKAKEEAFASEVKELGRLRQDMEAELKKMDQELASKLVKDIFEIARKIGEERGYTAILQVSPQTVYVNKSADITDEIIKIYDTRR
ncbi:MAG: OmpH family outer membrane protein [Candidatus Omnitrophota bacterium]|jgi:outer membrane protein